MYSSLVKTIRSLFYRVEPCFTHALRAPDLVQDHIQDHIQDHVHHHLIALHTTDRDIPTTTGLGTTHTCTIHGDRSS